MKRKLGLFILLFIMIAVPAVVKAQTPEVTISGPESASVNDKIDFTISAKVDKDTTAFEATVKYNTDILELTSVLKKDNWQGSNSISNTGNNTIKFSSTGVNGETNIVTLRFRVKSSEKSTTTISVEDIKITVSASGEEEAGTVVSANSAKKDITIKSDDNTLKNIKIDDKAITGFNSSINEYTFEVDSLTESIKLDATLNSKDTATFIDGFGPRVVSLEYGKNEVLVKTKSESGKEATYKLNITRKDDRESNYYLKSIVLNGGDVKISFDKMSFTYTVYTYKLEKIEVDAVADDLNAKVEVKAPEKLIIGDNEVKITVTAVTGKQQVYVIKVVNSEVPTDTRLRNLSVIGCNIGFNSDIFKYKIRYDKSYKNGLVLKHTSLSDRVQIEEIGNANLKAGSVIKVVVKALDGSSTSEYIITLEKDTRINFFLILDIVIALVVTVLIIIQLKKRKKIKEQKELEKEEELEKTKELNL